MKDIFSIAGFVILVLLGALFINSFLFRTFAVTGPSMEPTFYTADRVLVSRLSHTASIFTRRDYLPDRGQVIVFENPQFVAGQPDQFLVKRVIGLPGERVVLEDGRFTVYNRDNPSGLNPDRNVEGPRTPTDGEVDIVVPQGHIFVAGDNRISNFSLDSRNGLGTVPLEKIVGPVVLQFFPFNQIKGF